VQSARAEGAVRSAGSTVPRRARRAGRLGLGVGAILGLLPACQPERLIVIQVDRDDPLKGNAGISIAKLEARKGPDFEHAQHLNVTDGDGGSTIFPAFLGIYLRERSGPLKVKVFAYDAADDRSPVAGGERDGLMLDDERTQQFFAATEEVLLHSCKDNPLCGNSPPDGGDGGGDADAGTDAAPFDAGMIPPACTEYCATVINTCPTLYPRGQPQCEKSCAGADIDPGGLPCLIQQASIASGPEQCLAASLLSAVCTNGCRNYCKLGSLVCGDQLFPNQDCMTKCRALPPGDAESPRGDDSLLCRVSWLQDAFDNRSLCARALPAGPCQAQ